LTEILIVDNYDSFVYNIAQYLGELGAAVHVLRNDSPDLYRFSQKCDGFVISPGPGHPRDARGSLDIAANNGFGMPTLGVCLGHQVIAYVCGGNVVRAERTLHGKLGRVRHFFDPIFDGVPSEFVAVRYHSLIVERDSLPASLKILAESENKEIMALRVGNKPVYGLQFHPESVLTAYGKQILSNFLRMCRK
jgi:anthranilate synthase/aminodeoxychorismate synthase-like glutamine amidotransferase